MPLSNCAPVIRTDSAKLFNVSREIRSCSWSAAIVSQAVAVSEIRLIRVASAPAWVAKYCSCAARVWLRMRPKRSSSNAETPANSE